MYVHHTLKITIWTAPAALFFWSCRTGQQVYRSWLENARWHHCCRFLTQQRHRCVSQRGGCCFSYSRFRDCLAWKTEQGGNFHFEQKSSFNRACMPVPLHVHPFPQISQTMFNSPNWWWQKKKGNSLPKVFFFSLPPLLDKLQANWWVQQGSGTAEMDFQLPS